jgi:hypothetical protein
LPDRRCRTGRSAPRISVSVLYTSIRCLDKSRCRSSTACDSRSCRRLRRNRSNFPNRRPTPVFSTPRRRAYRILLRASARRTFVVSSLVARLSGRSSHPQWVRRRTARVHLYHSHLNRVNTGDLKWAGAPRRERAGLARHACPLAFGSLPSHAPERIHRTVLLE